MRVQSIQPYSMVSNNKKNNTSFKGNLTHLVDLTRRLQGGSALERAHAQRFGALLEECTKFAGRIKKPLDILLTGPTSAPTDTSKVVIAASERDQGVVAGCCRNIVEPKGGSEGVISSLHYMQHFLTEEVTLAGFAPNGLGVELQRYFARFEMPGSDRLTINPMA